MILVTGGAGFIGSNFIRKWLQEQQEPVVNLDKLTYAGNPENLDGFRKDPRYIFQQGSIGDVSLLNRLLGLHQPRAILNFAAESHVDRSIYGPADFIDTNVVGTFHLLQSATQYWQTLPQSQRGAFRFIQISTDEVYGTLAADEASFSETTAFAPNNPYSAGKAAGDHLVRAWHHTYGLPVITTHCGNNYGPFQFPEKLIPLVIVNALAGKPLPVYGDGLQIRDWLYVGDHCEALFQVLLRGRPGATYNIGAHNEQTNLAVVHAVCALLDELRPHPDRSYSALISHVADRPGHDRRYALNAERITSELQWQPAHKFEEGLRKSVLWYLEHPEWVRRVQNGAYLQWMEQHYGQLDSKDCDIGS